MIVYIRTEELRLPVFSSKQPLLSQFERFENYGIDKNKQKKLLLCLILVGLWILDYLCPAPIIQLDSSYIRGELYNERGAQVVKDPHT